MSFEAYSRSAASHGGRFSDESPTSSCEEDFGYDSVSPTQLLSVAIRKRREQYEEKDCDLKRQVLHTGMIRSLCKYLGEGRAKRRRSRHRSSRRKASKRRWDDAGEKQDGSGMNGGSDEDSGFESSSPNGSPPSPSNSPRDKFQVVPVDIMDSALSHETPRHEFFEFTTLQTNGDDSSLGCGNGKGPAKRAKFSDERCGKSAEHSIVDDFLDCDPFGLDNLCTPPPSFADERGGLPVYYSSDFCDSTWTFNGRVEKYSSRDVDESTATKDVRLSVMDCCVTPTSGYSSQDS